MIFISKPLKVAHFFSGIFDRCQVSMQPSLCSSSTRDLWKRSQIPSTTRSPTNWWLVCHCFGHFFPRVIFFGTKVDWKQKNRGKKWTVMIPLKVGQKKHRKLHLIWNGTGGTGTFFMCHWTRLKFYSKHDERSCIFFGSIWLPWTNPFLFIRSGHWKSESNQLMPRWWRRILSGVLTLACFPLWKSRDLNVRLFFGIRSADNIWVFPKIVGFPPKSSILIEFSIINHPFWGFYLFGNTHLYFTLDPWLIVLEKANP